MKKVLALVCVGMLALLPACGCCKKKSTKHEPKTHHGSMDSAHKSRVSGVSPEGYEMEELDIAEIADQHAIK